MRPTRKAACGLLLALAALFAGCGEQELYGGLSQRQANEMVAVLRNAGIAADKQPRDAASFAIVAPKADFAQAIELLRANGYPREGFDTLGGVFKKEGFVSSPLEERARLNYALSQEIANTIASIDGVVIARVHLAVPEKDPLADKHLPASASVFVKHRPSVDLSTRVSQIKALVVNSIEGLPYDNVTVALFPAEPLPSRATPAPRPVIDPALLWGLGGAGLLALTLGGSFWWLQRRRGVAEPDTPSPTVSPPAVLSRVPAGDSIARRDAA